MRCYAGRVLSPTTKRAITNLVVITLMGGGGYYFYKHRTEMFGAGDSKTACQQKLDTVLAACNPVCEGTGRRIVAVREQYSFVKDPECMDNCSRREFGYPVPKCGRVHRTAD
jgi:hypothetical protein